MPALLRRPTFDSVKKKFKHGLIQHEIALIPSSQSFFAVLSTRQRGGLFSSRRSTGTALTGGHRCVPTALTGTTGEGNAPACERGTNNSNAPPRASSELSASSAPLLEKRVDSVPAVRRGQDCKSRHTHRNGLPNVDMEGFKNASFLDIEMNHVPNECKKFKHSIYSFFGDSEPFQIASKEPGHMANNNGHLPNMPFKFIEIMVDSRSQLVDSLGSFWD